MLMQMGSESDAQKEDMESEASKPTNNLPLKIEKREILEENESRGAISSTGFLPFNGVRMTSITQNFEASSQ